MSLSLSPKSLGENPSNNIYLHKARELSYQFSIRFVFSVLWLLLTVPISPYVRAVVDTYAEHSTKLLAQLTMPL